MEEIKLENIPDEFDCTDGDKDMNEFEQIIHRAQPFRATRRAIRKAEQDHITRMNQLLNESEKINEPRTGPDNSGHTPRSVQTRCFASQSNT